MIRVVELYEFVQAESETLFTSSAENVSYDGKVYAATNIKRSATRQDNDIFKNGLDLTFDRKNTYALELMGQSVDIPIILTVRAVEYDIDDEIVNDYIVWKGRLISIEGKENKIVVMCESVFTSLKRAGLRPRYETLCRHEVFDAGCRLNEADYLYEETIVEKIDNHTFRIGTIGTAPDGYYTAGLITFADGSTRLIIKQVGHKITISRGSTEVNVGEPVKLLPGCDKARETCRDKFDNVVNFGGWPFIPTRNPFTGNSIV